MTILGLFLLMIVMAVVHEIGHALILKALKIDFESKGFSLTFDDTKISNKELIAIIVSGIGLGLLPLLLAIAFDDIPSGLIITLMIWYVWCCKHDLKMIFGILFRGELK